MIKKTIKGCLAIMIILCIIDIVSGDDGSNKIDDTPNEILVKEDVINKVSLEELHKNITNYIDKKIKIEGYIIADTETDNPFQLSDGENYYVITNMYQKDIENNGVSSYDYVELTGKIEKNNENYIFMAENINLLTKYEGSFETQEVESLFNKRKEAYFNTANNLNPDTFFRNPKTYADDKLYMISGKVTDINHLFGGTIGLIDITGNDDYVEFTSSTELNLQLNDEVNFLSKIKPQMSDYELTMYNGTTKSVPCPTIEVESYLYQSEKIYNFTEEEKEFIYNKTYKMKDGYSHNLLGDKFYFSENKIGNYKYTLNSASYSYAGTLYIGGRTHLYYPSFRISLSLTVHTTDGDQQVHMACYFDNRVDVDGIWFKS